MTKWFKDEYVSDVASEVMAYRIYEGIRDRLVQGSSLSPVPAPWDDMPKEFREMWKASCLNELDSIVAQMVKDFDITPKDTEEK